MIWGQELLLVSFASFCITVLVWKSSANTELRFSDVECFLIRNLRERPCLDISLVYLFCECHMEKILHSIFVSQVMASSAIENALRLPWRNPVFLMDRSSLGSWCDNVDDGSGLRGYRREAVKWGVQRWTPQVDWAEYSRLGGLWAVGLDCPWVKSWDSPLLGEGLLCDWMKGSSDRTRCSCAE